MSESRCETILIVEDDPGVARLEERRLSRAGYHVVTAHSTSEAMAAVRRDDIDLIILDQKLPGGTDGLDFYAELKQIGLNVPAILVTGLNDEQTLLRAIRAGLRDFVPKTTAFLDDLSPIVDRVMQQVRVEQRLAESESRLAAIIRSAIDAVVTIDAGGRISLFNPAAERVFGIHSEQALGQPIDRYVIDYDPARHTGSGERFECLGRRNDGSAFPLEASSTHTEAGGLILQTLFLRDLTEHKRAEAERAELIRSQAARAEAEAANLAKDRFLAMLSHELRTPLSPVLMAVDVALENPDTTPENRSILSMIQRNVRLQARLIDDLLDVTRIARGKLALRRERIDVHSLIDQTLEICRSEIDNGSLELVLDLHARDTTVEGDSTRLQQILWNLIKNAVKFTGAGGRITIRTHNEPAGADTGPGGIAIAVIDSGIGIDPAVLPKVFEPFEQGSSSTTRRYGGLGLGLSISRSVAEAHGGRLTASSPGRGAGATFTLSLRNAPRAAGAAPAPAAPTAEDPAIRRILLVEDDPDSRKVVTRMLQRRGYSVQSAETLEEAITAVRAQPFDLVISDIRLPDGSGLDLMSRLREVRPTRGIVLSGVGREDDIRQSLESGFLDHLIKPVDVHVLEDSIRRVASMSG